MNATAGFSPLNYTILATYLLGMIVVGIRFARRQRNTEDYFLAGRRMPWLVVGMSMYASLTSAITFMALPATAYHENISFLVVSLVSPLVAPFLVVLFYPFYHRLRVTTSYEYIDARFGRAARFCVSGLFVLARLGWLGTVIYAPALALSTVTGISLTLCLVAMGLLATIYTTLGGLAADIWTDVVQFVIMVGGVFWLIATLVSRVPGGAESILATAAETGRLHVLNWKFDLYSMSGIVVGLTYFFKLMQDYGTDQTTVQRMMAVPTMRGIARAIFFNAAVDFAIISSLLFVGLGLFAYHQAFPDRLPDHLARDQILPYYIIHALPDGVSGLLITALFAAAMSSVDSGISCISTVLVNDFIRPLRKRERGESADLKLARALTFALGVLATAVSFYIASFGHLIKAYTSLISLFNAPILALFLLGMLSRRARFEPWVAGAALAVAANLFLQHRTAIHWIYYFPCSLMITLLVGYAGSRLMPAPILKPGLTVWDRKNG
ncbi:MAG: sodium/solute symporter [Kiritimatiellae bacterium]|nr:sodium/solute symporter [Kiritimatiellia bacterium]MDW8458591.1 sodium/solute symporter [Verrucomicrobiota bacterium]